MNLDRLHVGQKWIEAANGVGQKWIEASEGVGKKVYLFKGFQWSGTNINLDL